MKIENVVSFSAVFNPLPAYPVISTGNSNVAIELNMWCIYLNDRTANGVFRNMPSANQVP